MPDPSPIERRFELIDAVRGFALFGVLLANLVWWTQDWGLSEAQQKALPTAAVDETVRIGVAVLVDGKFYTLFSFLFGLGFALQLGRGKERGIDMAPVYRRRLWILLAIGLIHGFVFWNGDILHIYALLGFLLLATRRWSERALLRWGLLFAVLVPAAGDTLVHASSSSEQRETMHAAIVTQHHAMLTSGGPADVVRYNFTSYAGFFASWEFLPFLSSIVGRFLLGALAGRRRWLQEPPRGTLAATRRNRRAAMMLASSPWNRRGLRRPIRQGVHRHERLLRRMLGWGLACAVAATALGAVDELDLLPEDPPIPIAFLLALIENLGVLGLAAAYLATVVLLYRVPVGRRALGWLAPVGRMALSNYLTHTLLILACFYDFGFDLTGRVGATFCLGFAVVVYAAQVLFSAWWLRRYRFGPGEWLWRSLTYRQFQPMRRQLAV